MRDLPPSIHGVFVSGEVPLDLSFPTARPRLASLIRGGLLERVSAQSYGGEITGLAQVHVRDLTAPGDSARFALRWEVARPGGALFPVLDADITLIPAGEYLSTLTLAGVYRPPLGTAGAVLDRVVMRRVVTATIQVFLHHIAEAVACSVTAAEPEAEARAQDPPSPAQPETP